MTTGEKIKQLRKSLGMTQEELGEKIGVKKAAINKYETGLVVNLKRSTIYSLAKALGVSATTLLDDEELTLSSEEARLVTLYRGATASAREIALETLENHQEKKDSSADQMA